MKKKVDLDPPSPRADDPTPSPSSDTTVAPTPSSSGTPTPEWGSDSPVTPSATSDWSPATPRPEKRSRPFWDPQEPPPPTRPRPCSPPGPADPLKPFWAPPGGSAPSPLTLPWPIARGSGPHAANPDVFDKPPPGLGPPPTPVRYSKMSYGAQYKTSFGSQLLKGASDWDSKENEYVAQVKVGTLLYMGTARESGESTLDPSTYRGSISGKESHEFWMSPDLRYALDYGDIPVVYKVIRPIPVSGMNQSVAYKYGQASAQDGILINMVSKTGKELYINRPDLYLRPVGVAPGRLHDASPVAFGTPTMRPATLNPNKKRGTQSHRRNRSEPKPPPAKDKGRAPR